MSRYREGERPVRAMAILRFADGETQVQEITGLTIPESREHKHEMLIDALAEVNKGRVL